jgi:hypothetical protein
VHLLRVAVLTAAVAVVAGCGDSKQANSNDKSSSASVHHSGPGTSNSAPSSGSASVTNNKAPLKVRMTGKCRSKANGGVLYPLAKNFTTNSTFHVYAWYPDGSPYRYLNHKGKTNAQGQLVRLSNPTQPWGWACGDGANGQPDPPGRYTVQFKDDATGRSTPRKGRKHAVHFRVLKAH